METYTGSEAMQLLVVHHKHPEYNIELSSDEVRHLELSVIDDWELVLPSWKRMLAFSTKLEVLSAMSNNRSYLR